MSGIVSPVAIGSIAVIIVIVTVPVAMAAAAASLSCGGLVIKDPDCVDKSYPRFWKDFKKTFR